MGFGSGGSREAPVPDLVSGSENQGWGTAMRVLGPTLAADL